MEPDLTEADFQRWPHFTRQEFECRGNADGSGECRMNPDFLDLIEKIREEFGPLTVDSGYRSPAHNAAVSHTGATGPHTTGRAADFPIRGADALRLIKVALEHGITGVGVSQKDDSHFIHLDNLVTPEFPRPMVWSY